MDFDIDVIRQALAASGDAMMKIILVVLCGVLATYKGIFNEKGISDLGRVVYNITLPALVFTNIVKEITLHTLTSYWILPVFCVIHVFLAYSLSVILTWILQLEKSESAAVKLCVMFGNVGTLSIAIIGTLCVDEPLYSEIGDNCVTIGISYIAVYLLMNTFLLFTCSDEIVKQLGEGNNELIIHRGLSKSNIHLSTDHDGEVTSNVNTNGQFEGGNLERESINQVNMGGNDMMIHQGQGGNYKNDNDLSNSNGRFSLNSMSKGRNKLNNQEDGIDEEEVYGHCYASISTSMDPEKKKLVQGKTRNSTTTCKSQQSLRGSLISNISFEDPSGSVYTSRNGSVNTTTEPMISSFSKDALDSLLSRYAIDSLPPPVESREFHDYPFSSNSHVETSADPHHFGHFSQSYPFRSSSAPPPLHSYLHNLNTEFIDQNNGQEYFDANYSPPNNASRNSSTLLSLLNKEKPDIQEQKTFKNEESIQPQSQSHSQPLIRVHKDYDSTKGKNNQEVEKMKTYIDPDLEMKKNRTSISSITREVEREKGEQQEQEEHEREEKEEQEGQEEEGARKKWGQLGDQSLAMKTVYQRPRNGSVRSSLTDGNFNINKNSYGTILGDPPSPNLGSRGSSTTRGISVSFIPRFKRTNLWKRFLRPSWRIIKHAAQTPTIRASALAIFCACFPPLQNAITTGLLKPVLEATEILGKAQVPISLLMLSGSGTLRFFNKLKKESITINSDGSRSRNKSSETGMDFYLHDEDGFSNKAIFAIMIGRVVILPLIGIGVLQLFRHLYAINFSPLLELILLLQCAVPTAQNIVMLVLIHGTPGKAAKLANIILWQYAFAFPILCLYVAYFIIFVKALSSTKGLDEEIL